MRRMKQVNLLNHFSSFSFILFCYSKLDSVFGNEILQDEGLDAIGEGLETLKNMASDMNEVACCAIFFYMI